ncbi:MAG TPA: hypothetical protein VII92_00950 [Anaerolineae bacterium]
MDAWRWDFTTTAAGAASKTSPNFIGKLYGIAVILGTAAAIDVTVANAEAITLFTKTTLAAGMHLVRKQVEDAAGVALVYSAGNAVEDMQPVVGPLTLTIANGGDAKTASLILYLVP